MEGKREICDVARVVWDPNGDQKQLVRLPERDGQMRAKEGLPEAGVGKG